MLSTLNVLPGYKTILGSIFFTVFSLLEIFGVFDAPWITDPWVQLQAALLFWSGRLGIKEVENAVKNG